MDRKCKHRINFYLILLNMQGVAARLQPSGYRSKQVVMSVDLTGHLTDNFIGRLLVKP